MATGPLIFGWTGICLSIPALFWGDYLGIKPFEAADYLQSDEAPEDAALFTKAVGDIARARGMMQLARNTGITREGLYKALGEQATPASLPL